MVDKKEIVGGEAYTRGLTEAAEALRKAERVLVLTGADLSAESGIPIFSGDRGLWEGYSAEELATAAAFASIPETVWRWCRWQRCLCLEAETNSGHQVIARLEEAVPSFLLATQSIDGLHQRAGNQHVLELHGSIHRGRCLGCGDVSDLPASHAEGAKDFGDRFWDAEAIPPGRDEVSEEAISHGQSLQEEDPSPSEGERDIAKQAEAKDAIRAESDQPRDAEESASKDPAESSIPLCAHCGSPMRPHILWAGENYWPGMLKRAMGAADRVDLVMVVGASGQVSAPAAIAMHAAERGAFLIEINPEESQLSTLANAFLQGKASKILPELWTAIQQS